LVKLDQMRMLRGEERRGEGGERGERAVDM
jgi:hypothetical protein